MLANHPLDNKQSRRWIYGIAVLAHFLLSGCSPQSFFFYPNRVLYNDPDRFPPEHELVTYAAPDGKKLVAVYFKTDRKPLGTIVHFHGNFGNVSNHFPLALFLTRYGFDVLAFDYEGYGASEGQPTIERLVQDGKASVDYAAAHLRASGTGVAILGQSLGASIAIAVTAQDPRVRALVAEAPFTGFSAMARAATSRHILMWPLYPFTPFMSSKEDALRWIADISPRPILLIHGDADTIVPVRMSKKLLKAAKDPKQLWIVSGAGHLDAHRTKRDEYEKIVSDFFTAALR